MDNYIDCSAIIKKVTLPENAKLVILHNSGHMGFIEEEELSIETVRDFVNGLRTTA
jgi:pimeloyl-ACP methyl ester carboxylesterase